MDLNGLLRLIFLEKSDLTVGVLIGLTLLVVVLMLVRSVMEEKSAASAGTGAVDQKTLNIAVEGAIKKALADKPIAKTSDAAGGGEPATGDVTELSKTLSAREAKIATLVAELETLKIQSEAKSTGGGSGGDIDNSADLLSLTEKVKELQAKLSEYEIIEDDIADLSIFKEENKKLKDEIEKLRSAAQTAQVQVQSAQASVESPSPSSDAVQAAQSAIVDAPQNADAIPVRPPNEAFKLDTDDAVMGEFAQAISGASLVDDKPASSMVEAEPVAAVEEAPAMAEEEVADPFGPLDTDKMLAEVASLNESAEVSTSVLEDELDTDRLMAEMGMSEPVTPSADPEVAEPAAAPVATPIAPSVAMPAAEVHEVAKAVDVAPPPAVATPEPAERAAAALLAAAPAAAAVPAVKPVIVEAPDPAKDVPVDDLLAEFQDNDYPTLKGTKGS